MDTILQLHQSEKLTWITYQTSRWNWCYGLSQGHPFKTLLITERASLDFSGSSPRSVRYCSGRMGGSYRTPLQILWWILPGLFYRPPTSLCSHCFSALTHVTLFFSVLTQFNGIINNGVKLSLKQLCITSFLYARIVFYL